MVKSANFNTRQETNSLLPKERKPNFSTNYSGIKKFYVKALSQAEQKKQGSDNKSQRGGGNRGRGSRGRGKYRRNNNYYNNNNQYNNQGNNYGYNRNNQGQGNFNQGQGNYNNQGFYRPPMSQQKLDDLRNNACFYCHKSGHSIANCTSRNSSNSQGNKNVNQNKK